VLGITVYLIFYMSATIEQKWDNFAVTYIIYNVKYEQKQNKA